MCALAHVFERAGVPTVVVGLVPQHVARMRPPRALLVPFELGRPFAVPHDSVFQHRVLDAAFGLASRMDVPVSEWFESAAPVVGSQELWACPVNFAVTATSEVDSDDVAAVLDEIALLRPWHDRASITRGGDSIGASGLEIDEAVRWLGKFLDGDIPGTPVEDLPLADAFKLAAEDLKLFYQVAAAAQPGGGSRAIGDWFWDATRAGAMIRNLALRLGKAEDPALRAFASFTLVPEARRRAPNSAE